MSGKKGARIFVGGLSWETTERDLEAAFSRFGKVIDVQIMVERDSGRPRGFGFVTFVHKRAMEASISLMHNKELGGRQISVSKAEPKMGSDDAGYGYGPGGYSSGGRGGYRGGADDPPPEGLSECFKCGCQGHWARECPSAGGDGEIFYTRSRIDGGRYEGGRYGDRDRLEDKDSSHNGGRDRYTSDCYPPVVDRLSGDRHGSGPDRYPLNGYSKKRSFDRDEGPRGGGNRYGSGGPARYKGGGGYRKRPRPHDRPNTGVALPVAAQPSPQVVGIAFVMQYYVILLRSPDLVHRFYQDSSIVSRPDSNGVMTSVTTMEAIDNNAFSLVFSNCNVELESPESQASYKDGVLVDVTGSLIGRDNNIRRKFTQSFFLAPQEGGYVVLNDIFRFVDLGQPREANEVIVNANEPDTDDIEEVVDPLENVAPAGEDAISADPEIHLGHSDHQLISEATASVSQQDKPNKSYASIELKEKKKRPRTVAFERKK